MSPLLTPESQIEMSDAADENVLLSLLNSLVQEALGENPAIRSSLNAWQAATKRPSQESSLPNPEFQVGSMSSPNPLPFSTLGDGPLSWASFMFSQKIPWPGKLALKGEIAANQAAQQAQAYKAVTLQVIQRLKEAFFQLYASDQTLKILAKYRELLEQIAKIAEARYAVGEGHQQDVLRSQVEISLLLERIELTRQRRQTATARINSLLNRSPDVTFAPLPEDLEPSITLPFSLEEMYLQAREQNPEIEKERLGIQQASLELNLARKELRPNFTASGGYFLRGGPFDNMYQYQLGVEIPLYFWRKERLGVEEGIARLEGNRFEYQNALQEVTYQIKDAYLGVRTAQRLLELYRRGIIPQATATLDSSLSGYQVGKLDFQTLVENALTILTYEIEYQEQLRVYFQSLSRLEQSLGFVIVK